MSTMSAIFVVHLTAGCRCCDGLDRAMRAFGNKGEAETYMKDLERQVSFNLGIEKAIDCMMAEWSKSHPAVDYPTGGQHLNENYDVARQAYDAYMDLRGEERKRLEALLGWNSDLDLRWEKDYDFYIDEIPFGAVVVKPAEEVDQAAE